MKYIKFAVIVGVLFCLGYILGPTLNPMLVSEKKPEGELAAEVKYRGAFYRIDLAEIRDAQLPEMVTLKTSVALDAVEGEGKVSLAKGDEVELLNRDQDSLIVETLNGKGKGKIDPKTTDVYDFLARAIYAEEAGEAPMVPKRTPTEKPMMSDTPNEMAGGQEMGGQEMAPEPTPEPEVEAVAAPAELGEEAIIALMQESIAAGAINEFTSEQVKNWAFEGDETVDGTDYQVGVASYEAKTIFGKRVVKAKALIKGGKVERWVFAKSGMEIQ